MKESFFPTLIVSAIVGLIILSAFASADRNKWLREHCEIIGKVSGSVGTAMTFNSGKDGGVGFGPVSIPGKTGYKCDDGIEYWE